MVTSWPVGCLGGGKGSELRPAPSAAAGTRFSLCRALARARRAAKWCPRSGRLSLAEREEVLTGRPVDGNCRWSMSAVRQEADRTRSSPASTHKGDPSPCDDAEVPFPAVRRFVVKRPDFARFLSTVVGARRGSRDVAVITKGAHGERV